MGDINEAMESLRLSITSGNRVPVTRATVKADDLRALLDDHARLRSMAEELERFRALARWVSNCAGHGVNANQRRLGEELLVLIDAAKAVQP